jgi:hypothetical protein
MKPLDSDDRPSRLILTASVLGGIALAVLVGLMLFPRQRAVDAKVEFGPPVQVEENVPASAQAFQPRHPDAGGMQVTPSLASEDDEQTSPVASGSSLVPKLEVAKPRNPASSGKSQVKSVSSPAARGSASAKSKKAEDPFGSGPL